MKQKQIEILKEKVAELKKQRDTYLQQATALTVQLQQVKHSLLRFKQMFRDNFEQEEAFYLALAHRAANRVSVCTEPGVTE